ncbi:MULTISPECIES: class I SAM-dependent methyltransferase [unclassified Rhizobium]|uniref:class I SAM-dependent methyltransferase n=1 Tax=unclassified Rhizobium TaxID=2613769 RepID=UPI0007EA57B3|nr:MULTISPECIES: class I SAM-dependent methyltransferase [unclassified Rhizobium]
MAQITSGIHSILSVPAIYDLAQTIMGASRNRNWMQREFIRARPGERVLDVGCGTADILSVMPEIDYVGFDISEPYIAKAKARWGKRGEFHAEFLDSARIEHFGKFDLILATGLLHHLDDHEVDSLFETLAKGLKPGGRIITVDGTYVQGQNPVARFVISQDRGRSVRRPEAYTALAKSHFGNVEGWLEPRTWIPYTYWIMRIGH